MVDPKQERKLLIPWNDHSKTVQWLNDEIVNRCWRAFGQWVSAFRNKGLAVLTALTDHVQCIASTQPFGNKGRTNVC